MFPHLPIDLIESCFQFLNHTALCRTAVTAKEWRKFIYNNKVIWKQITLEMKELIRYLNQQSSLIPKEIRSHYRCLYIDQYEDNNNKDTIGTLVLKGAPYPPSPYLVNILLAKHVKFQSFNLVEDIEDWNDGFLLEGNRILQAWARLDRAPFLFDRLTHLNLKGLKVTSNAAKEFFDMLCRAGTRLKEINLRDNNLTRTRSRDTPGRRIRNDDTKH